MKFPAKYRPHVFKTKYGYWSSLPFTSEYQIHVYYRKLEK